MEIDTMKLEVYKYNKLNKLDDVCMMHFKDIFDFRVHYDVMKHKTELRVEYLNDDTETFFFDGCIFSISYKKDKIMLFLDI